MLKLLHNRIRDTSVTNVSDTDYPSVIFVLTNSHQLSYPCALHCHFGFILCAGDTSMAAKHSLLATIFAHNSCIDQGWK